jgi:hypothetical protein
MTATNYVTNSSLTSSLSSKMGLGGTQTQTADIIAGSATYKLYGATPTEHGYLSGVTSNIQNQLNNKQAAGSYLTSTGGTLSGNLSVTGTLGVTGNATFSGTLSTTGLTTDTGGLTLGRNVTLPTSLTTPTAGQLGYVTSSANLGAALTCLYVQIEYQNILSITLNPGVWIIYGVGTIGAASALTTMTSTMLMISNSATTLDDWTYQTRQFVAGQSIGGSASTTQNVTRFVTINSGTTTYYLNGYSVGSGAFSYQVAGTKLTAVRIA